jgi:hypothetical protein
VARRAGPALCLEAWFEVAAKGASAGLLETPRSSDGMVAPTTATLHAVDVGVPILTCASTGTVASEDASAWARTLLDVAGKPAGVVRVRVLGWLVLWGVWMFGSGRVTNFICMWVGGCVRACVRSHVCGAREHVVLPMAWLGVR